MTDTIAVQPPPENAQPPEASSAEPSPRKMRFLEKFLSGILAAMVSIYSILTAAVVYSASQAEDNYYNYVFYAQAHLSDSSELSIQANINLLHDINVLEQIYIHEVSGSNPEITEFLYGLFSDPARASLERSGEFDDIYSEEIFADHNEQRELAMEAFTQAIAWSQRGGTYETLATILAVGLAFAAWASLMQQTGWVRWLFVIVAALILISGLVFWSVQLATSEPLV